MQISRLCLFSKRRIASASFTLVELLIVIGILAILTAAVVVIMQPTERLREARDSTRIQELSSLEKTIQLLSTQNSDLALGIANTVYISIADNASTTCGSLGLPSLPAGYSYSCVVEANLRHTDGTGWIPINFSSSGITTLTSLPIDPINTTSTGLYYTYMSGGSFELNGVLESQKHRSVASKDGGDSFSIFEKGSNKTLTPYSDTGLVGYWTFDEGSGSVARDLSGYGNNATVSSGVVYEQTKNGTAISQNSGLSVLNLASIAYNANHPFNFDYTSAFTESTWFKITSLPSPTLNYYYSAGILMKGDYAYSFGINAEYTKSTAQNPSVYSGFRKASGGAVSLDTGTLSTDSWNHIVFVYEPGVIGSATIRLYLNGVLKTSSSPTGITTFANTDGLYFGSKEFRLGSDWSDFRGSIDDARIYNRVLSAAEIRAIYNATR